MGSSNTQVKRQETKPERSQIQQRNTTYESNSNEFGKIKHTLKYLHKNNFVSLTYVLINNIRKI